MSTFGIYLIGYFIFVAGLVWALTLLGVPPVWIGVVAVVLTGLGILTGVGKTRRRDSSQD